MLRKTDIGTLNPLHLDEAGQHYLAAYLKQNASATIIKKNQRYAVELRKPNEMVSTCYEFSLTHKLIKRQRKDSKDKVSRYEVISNGSKIGKGGHAVILMSVGVLIPKNSRVTFKAKPRAIKKQYDTDLTKTEYAIAKKTKHLHIKPPSMTFFESKAFNERMTTFLAMRVMPGKNLHQIIEAEADGQPHLSASERLALSIAILRAIQAQSHENGLIHRDIKAENLMIDIETNEVNLIDFSYSKDTNDPTSLPDTMGTIIMMPPEQFICRPDDMPAYSEKSDCYAAGKTLAELWRAESEADGDRDYRTSNEAYMSYWRYAQKDTYFNFANFLADDLTEDHLLEIKNIFMQLTRARPDDRSTLDQAIFALESIQTERQAALNSKSRLGF